MYLIIEIMLVPKRTDKICIFGSYKVRMTMYEGGIEVMDPTVRANLTTVDSLIQNGFEYII